MIIQNQDSGNNNKAKKPFDIKMVYYDAGKRTFLWPTNNGWKSVPTDAMRRLLKEAGLSAVCKDGEPVSAIESALNQIQIEQDVIYSGPIAGHKAQLLTVAGQRLLVTSSPELIEPKPGEWTVLRQFIENLLGPQAPYLYGWLKVAVECLMTGRFRTGQMLALAGPANCGKSLLQNLITKILGGRSAKPYMYLTGQTTFNSDLFAGEHLMIEDEAANTDYKSRRKFSAEMKQITANLTARFHPKGREAIMLSPFWRISVSVNNEPENLTVLPVLDDSVKDKIILLRANANAVPWATTTDDERKIFLDRLHSELPAFVWFLTNWTIPEELRSARYGIASYLDPELVQAIDGLSPEAKLWELIQIEILRNKPEWTGATRDLRAALFASCEDEARQILTYPNACGTYLLRLAGKKPYSDYITVSGGKNAKKWRILPEKKSEAA